MRASGISIILLAFVVGTGGCLHPGSGGRSQSARAKIKIERPENNGSVNIVPCTISLSDGQTCILTGGDSTTVLVRCGTFWVAASSLDPYAPSDSGYPVAWRSPRVAFHIGPGETVRLSVEPRSKGSTYIGGWTIRRAANERAGVDAGCAILLASERAWPGTTHRER